MTLTLPKLSLVLLIGPSGSGKSTFGRKHFLPTEVVSSDSCRGVVSDDENAQDATEDAFDLLHFIVRTRLRRGKLTVVDATNVQEGARRSLLRIADEFHVPAAAIVFDLPESVCHRRNADRPDRQFGPHVIKNQLKDMRRAYGRLEREGFKYVFGLRSEADVEEAAIERVPLWPDRSELTGPFDIVGDVHGCADELFELLDKLGYKIEELAEPRVLDTEPVGGRPFVGMHTVPVYYDVVPPEGRMLAFVGDLVDRGPDSPRVLKLAMSMVRSGAAVAVPGNHDVKLIRHLRGRPVSISHGLQETIDQLAKQPEEFVANALRFLDSLVSHAVLDGGKLVIAHAGLKAEMQGRASGRVKEFCLYGDTTGETDEFGLPIRYPWASDYRGSAMVVYGHTPVPEAEWLNGTINIDTGCVFGGKLTALRYPEREVVSVPARQMYAASKRPFLETAPPDLSAQQVVDDVLDLEDVSGKRLIATRLKHVVTIREENATAALETISRFAVNPKWLVYLPPTMSPSETSHRDGYLEYPEEAIAYYRDNGVETVVCEEKHMGSRAVVILCRDEEVARQRFGVLGEGMGTVITRTGRRFFEDALVEQELLGRVAQGISSAGLWEELETDWMVLDAELMPWSAKARELLRTQYAPVGAAAIHAHRAATALLEAPRLDDQELGELRGRNAARAGLAEAYVEGYRRYCWPVNSLDDYRLAPFHLLATEGAVHTDKPHTWHMEMLGRFCGDGLLFATPYRVVQTGDPDEVAAAVAWWEELTGKGGEGMVVKPLDFIVTGARGLIQPAVKCRGREYLRIIYGPEYSIPENLQRLRKRGLGVKRSLALREFALGVEGLERFVRREPLRRVHECAFGVLALESEPVDPRL
ncbi:polynucleotide kinase-phosphatase [Fimbriimonas ginsengisoli]|uniref:Putative phosphatase n=1 Tax=Fimbriimonas ginsengisoli Gsoil 348 TaxID=661478 RepID=A0A068NKG5_FIMGI|nr:polynucleotide kinase-phosphatase [Fimbriimonas ginsengisoli]AIE84038.1 putative phosphatase [Fimbriimonas ginsengisoli Gsoil 348]